MVKKGKVSQIVVSIAALLIIIAGAAYLMTSEGPIVGQAGKTLTGSSSRCIDYDKGALPFSGSYVVMNDPRTGKSFHADSCESSTLLVEAACDRKGSLQTKKIDCSKQKGSQCLMTVDGYAYCGNPQKVPSTQKVQTVSTIVSELDRAFRETEQKFGPIRTLEKLDQTKRYPVDFGKEKLFQHYLTYFLAGEYEKANAVHIRIAEGLLGMNQDTVRKVDWALAAYYTKLLSDPALNSQRRAGIRGTIAPAINVVELLQYTGVSNIRRVMDRYDGGKATLNTLTGSPVAGGLGSPFISASSAWPEQIGIQCLNYGKGTLDRYVKRKALGVKGSSTRIDNSRFTNEIEGMVTYLTDERLQGLQDCTCQEVLENDFVCLNQLLCGGGQEATPEQPAGGTAPPSQLPSQLFGTSQGMQFDSLTPDAEIPTVEEMMQQICDFSKKGGVSPWNRAGACATTLAAAAPEQSTQIASCVKNYNDQKQIQVALNQQYGIPDYGCTQTEESDERGCEGEECGTADAQLEETADNWEQERDERAEHIYNSCKGAGCTMDDVYEAIDSGINDLRAIDSEDILVGEGYDAGLGTTIVEDTENFIVFRKDVLENGGGNGYVTGQYYSLSEIADHESWHIVLDNLGIPTTGSDEGDAPTSSGGTQHNIIDRWNARRGGGSSRDIDDSGGSSCTAADQLVNDLYECTTPGTNLAEQQPPPGSDPVGPYVQPDPNDPGMLGALAAAQPILSCAASQGTRDFIFEITGARPVPPTSSRPGPDCNFDPTDCCRVNPITGSCIWIYEESGRDPRPRPGCEADQTPVDPEQCSQSQCPEGQVPVVVDGRITCADEPQVGCPVPPCGE